MMSTTVDTSVIQNLGLAQQKPEGASGELGQEDFLKLMITQLENQDPLKPMENGDFLGQMAQFGTVSGIQDLQQTFQGLSNALSSNQALQASSMIGRSVMVPGDKAVLEQGKNIIGQLELNDGAQQVVVLISDASGQEVKRVSLGHQAPGTINFAWDGVANDGTVAPPGLYQIKAAASVDGGDIAVATNVNALVQSVSVGRGNEGMLLNLAGLGQVDFNKVKQIQ